MLISVDVSDEFCVLMSLISLMHMYDCVYVSLVITQFLNTE